MYNHALQFVASRKPYLLNRQARSKCRHLTGYGRHDISRTQVGRPVPNSLVCDVVPGPDVLKDTGLGGLETTRQRFISFVHFELRH